jgi:hypothetical protein
MLHMRDLSEAWITDMDAVLRQVQDRLLKGKWVIDSVVVARRTEARQGFAAGSLGSGQSFEVRAGGGARLANDSGTQLWDVAARKLVATLPASPSAIDSVAFSPDGTILFIATTNGTELWDADTVQQFASLSPYEAQDAALSHNGALLAVDSSDEPIRLLSIPYAGNTLSYLCRMAGEPFPRPNGQSTPRGCRT